MMTTPSVKKKRKWFRTHPALAIAALLFGVYAVGLLFPVFFALNSSLKLNDPDFLFQMSRLSVPPNFKNYIEAFSTMRVGDTNYPMMFFNSVWFAGGLTFFNIFSSMCLAYGVAKYRFKGNKFLYNFALIIMVLPVFGTLPARYRLYSMFGFINSPLLLLAYTGAFDFLFLILHAFFKNLDWAYAESAFIDGAGHVKVYFKIMIPMAMPAVTALAVTNFIGAWNNYETVLMFLPQMPTLSTGLYTYLIIQRYNADRPVYYAGVVLAIIPIAVLFIGFQNTIMSRVYAGGIKG